MMIKRVFLDVAKKNKTFRKSARWVRYILERSICKIFKICCRTDNKLIYFTSFAGKSYCDSPKAIYEYMLNDSRYNDYSFVWAFKDADRYRFLENNRNTAVISSKSFEEKRIVSKAGYWITNYRMLDYYIPKDNQVYVQCWHGTPLKRLGYDLENSDNVMNSISEIRSKYKTDALRFKYILSPSAFATEKFSSAWNLKEFGNPNTVIEEGYPRNDRLITANYKETLNIRNEFGITEDKNKKLILYAPTWRDNQHDSKLGYVYKNGMDFDLLMQELSEEYIILFRAHYLVANAFDFARYKGFVIDVSKYDDINDLYLASDMLITDYSSVFFDYANLKKPMVFFMYDMEAYRDSLRGFYFDINELPGKIVTNEQDLIGVIKEIEEQGWEPDRKYQEFCAKYNYLDDGYATERTVKRIFE